MVTQLLSLKLGPISSCSFSPDGGYFALSLHNHNVLILDVETGKTLQNLTGHTRIIQDCSFSPSGFSLATVSSDKTARIWNTQTGKVFHILQGHTSDVCSCTFSHDGVLLGTGSLDGTIHLWDAFTGLLVDILSEGWFHPITSCIFSPNGYVLAEGSLDTSIRIWDTYSVRVRSYLEADIMVKHSHGGVSLPHLEHDLGLIRPRAVLTGHTAAILSCSFLKDGNVLCSIANDSTLRLWDVVLACSLCLIEIVTDQASVPLWNCDISYDVIAASVGVGSIFLIDSHSENVIYCFQGHDDYVTACQFSHGGDILATCSQDGVLCVWEIPTISELSKTGAESADQEQNEEKDTHRGLVEIHEPDTALDRALVSLLHPQQEHIHDKYMSKLSHLYSPPMSQSDMSLASQEDVRPMGGNLSRSRAFLNLTGFKSDGSSHDDVSSDGLFSPRYNASSSSLSTYSGRSHASDEKAKGMAKYLMMKRLSSELTQRVRGDNVPGGAEQKDVNQQRTLIQMRTDTESALSNQIAQNAPTTDTSIGGTDPKAFTNKISTSVSKELRPQTSCINSTRLGTKFQSLLLDSGQGTSTASSRDSLSKINSLYNPDKTRTTELLKLVQNSGTVVSTKSEKPQTLNHNACKSQNSRWLNDKKDSKINLANSKELIVSQSNVINQTDVTRSQDSNIDVNEKKIPPSGLIHVNDAMMMDKNRTDTGLVSNSKIFQKLKSRKLISRKSSEDDDEIFV